MAYKKNRDELVRDLREQVGLLRTSAESYDAGNSAAAKHLALQLRILLHDSRTSKALLALLGEKHKLRFIDTAGSFSRQGKQHLGGNRFSETRSVGSRLAPAVQREGRWMLRAQLGERQTRDRLRFSEWWNNVVVILPGSNPMNRGDLVRGVANKDGGAHVDAVLEGGYAKLLRQTSLSVVSGEMASPIGPANPSLPMIRQIAYEVDTTLQEQISDLLGES
jgi:hypothetical protein